MKLSRELDYRIRYDVEHDLFHAQNVFNDEYITPTFIEYVQKLEAANKKISDECHKLVDSLEKKQNENAELKEKLEIEQNARGDWFGKAVTKDRRLNEAKEIIDDLVHLGEFNEHTDEEYINYQVHEALKNAEQFLKGDY